MFLVFSDKCLNVTVQLLHSWDRLELLNKTKLEIYNKKNHFFTHDQFGRILKFTDTNFFSKSSPNILSLRFFLNHHFVTKNCRGDFLDNFLGKLCYFLV